MSSYKVLKKQKFQIFQFRLIPLRDRDKFLIMKWRNEQIYHLRQKKLLTERDQNLYFRKVVKKLFKVNQPNQLLFSYMRNNNCIGYGGLVHIDWFNKNAEISFIMDTKLETKEFDLHWSNYLTMIEEIGFSELEFHKLYTIAYDIRPNLFITLESSGYSKEAVFKEHILFKNKFIDAVMHSKINSNG